MIEHLARGLRILGERWWPGKWLAAGENWLDTAVRYGMVGGAGYIGWRVVSVSWMVLGGAVLVVVVLALRAATKAAKGQQPKRRPGAAKGTPELSPEDFVSLVRKRLGSFKAVHLATFANYLTEETKTRWTPDRVRATCRAANIPIRPKVRDLGGDRVSSGLHRDDLPPLPQPLSEEAQEGPIADYTAGGSGNATPLHDGNATTPTPTTRRVGDLRITSVEDADNPHRTHVTVADPTRKRAS